MINAELEEVILPTLVRLPVTSLSPVNACPHILQPGDNLEAEATLSTVLARVYQLDQEPAPPTFDGFPERI